ncbi:MAG: hypothetical protein HDR05_07645 [Lachnospiraceae bacterium]|nr:hypothetical protein [Lachnospiraceae bacterium]
MSSIISFISDACISIFLAIVGLIMLFSPYDKIKDIFPKLKSKKALKIAGAFFLFCGVVTLVFSLPIF